LGLSQGSVGRFSPSFSEKAILPVADIGLGKVAKLLVSSLLFTIFLRFSGLLRPSTAGCEKPWRLVWKRHNGSEENMKHGDSATLLITGL
jgi:hypothetical protein